MSVYDPHYGSAPHGAQDLYNQTPAPRADLTPMINWAGALVSLALIAGLVTWGYRLVQRDVSGVPVIAALEGPSRIQPEDPGGTQTEHQGLAVNRVQSEGTAAPAADKVILAPAPLDLSSATPPARVVKAVAAAPAPPVQDPAAAAQRLIEELAAANADTPEASPGEDAVPASLPGVSRSPRPAARPATRPAVTAERAAPIEAPAFVDPASIPSGTRLVQLGYYETEAQARDTWMALVDKYADYIGDAQPVVQFAEAGDTGFHRLRATGFEDMSQARQFCAVFSSDNLTCIPVVAK